MMKYVMMIATAIVLVASGANALTLKSGEVLTKDENGNSYVAGAGETISAQRNLEQNGYHIGGGMLFVKVDEAVAEVDLDDLAGKSDEAQRDVVRVAIGKAIGVDYVVGDVTAQDVIDGQLDATIGHDTAIFDATQEAIEAYERDIFEVLVQENGGYDDSEAVKAAGGHSFAEFCADENATGDKSGC